MKNRISTLTLGVICALGSGHAAAMGLGPIEVRSGLNQPLLADIPIIADGESVEGLRAQLAGPDDLRRVGIDASALSVPLQFEVLEDSRGRAVIRVTSYVPVREPYVSFLIEANWGKGRLLREYSVLLDPPVFAPAVVERVAPPPVVVTRQAPSPPTTPMPQPATPTSAPVAAAPPPPRPATPPAAMPPPPAAPRAETPPPSTAPASAPAPAERPDSYTVREGDALYDIASDNRGEASINQMMVAMLRANPNAFYKDNINALKKGAVLRIPEAATAREMSAAAAAAEVASQVRAWSGAEAPTLVADSGTPPSSAPKGAASSVAKDEDRLALVPPKAGSSSQSGTTRAGTAGGTGSAEAGELRGDLARTREQLTSREQEATELRSRVKELEKIGGESKRLLELRSDEIANLKRQLDQQEKRLAEAKQAAAAARAAVVKAGMSESELPVAPAPLPMPVEDTAAMAAVDAAATGVSDGDADDAAEGDASATALDPMSGTALAALADSDAARPVVPAVVDPTSEPAVVDSGTALADSNAAEDATSTTAVAISPPVRPWYRNPMYLGLGAIVLAVLGLIAVFGRRRRSVEVDVVDDERPSVAHAFAGGVLPSSSPAATMESGTLAAPIIGDDVLERALLDRRAGDPDNLEHHLDVLRHYHEMRDQDRFIDAAREMRSHVHETAHYAWIEAQELGRDLDPGHPLFSGTGEDSGLVGSASNDNDDDDFNFRPSSVEPPTPVSYQPAVTMAQSSPSVDLGDEDWSSDTPRAADRDDDDDSDDRDANASDDEVDGKDDDFDRPEIDRPEIDKPELNYEFDDLPESPRAVSVPALGEDAVATKLDLARAYVDMGDNDGARAMLQEVLTEGTSVQRDEARRLTDGLS